MIRVRELAENDDFLQEVVPLLPLVLLVSEEFIVLIPIGPLRVTVISLRG